MHLNKLIHHRKFPWTFTGVHLYFSKNVLSSNNETYKSLKHFIRKNEILVLRSDKDSSVSRMSRSDYLEISEVIIEEKVKKSTYKKAEDTTLQDLK